MEQDTRLAEKELGSSSKVSDQPLLPSCSGDSQRASTKLLRWNSKISEHEFEMVSITSSIPEISDAIENKNSTSSPKDLTTPFEEILQRRGSALSGTMQILRSEEGCISCSEVSAATDGTRSSITTIEESVADEDCTEGKSLGVLGAVASLTTILVGIGIVTVPVQAKNLGLAPALICCWISNLLTVYTGIRLANFINTWNIRNPHLIRKYEDVAFWSFGHCGYHFVQCVVSLFLFGLGIVYLALNAEQAVSFIKIFSETARENWGAGAKRIAILVISPIPIALAFGQNLKTLQYLTWPAAAAAVVCILLLIIEAIIAYSTVANWEPIDREIRTVSSTWHPKQIAACLGTFLGSFGITLLFPSIMDEMEDPTKFGQALVITYTVVGVIYTLLVIWTWLAYGNFNQNSVLTVIKQMPADFTEAFGDVQSWTGKTSKTGVAIFTICMIFNIMVSYPLLQVVLFKSIRSLLPATCDGQRFFLVKLAFMLGQCGLAVGVATQILTTFGFFASLCLPILVTAIPIICCDRIRRIFGLMDEAFEDEELMRSRMCTERTMEESSVTSVPKAGGRSSVYLFIVLDAIAIIIGVSIMFFGSWQEAETIIKSWKSD